MQDNYTTPAQALLSNPEALLKFWSMFDRTGDCWVWGGTRSSHGYGRYRFEGRVYFTHRIAWELAHGPIPAGLFSCHHCDNPPCGRPDHLFTGDAKANLTDSQSKHRFRGAYRLGLKELISPPPILPPCPNKPPRQQCLRCNYVWQPRTLQAPAVCARCLSPYWDRPRQKPKEQRR